MSSATTEKYVFDLAEAFALPELEDTPEERENAEWHGPDPVQILEQKLRRRDELLRDLPTAWAQGRCWEVGEGLREFASIAGALRSQFQDFETYCLGNPEVVHFCSELTQIELATKSADWQQCADIISRIAPVNVMDFGTGDRASLGSAVLQSVTDRKQEALSLILHGCGTCLTESSCGKDPERSLSAAQCALLLCPDDELAEAARLRAEREIDFRARTDALSENCAAGHWRQAESICSKLVADGLSLEEVETENGVFQIDRIQAMIAFRLEFPVVTVSHGVMRGSQEDVRSSLHALKRLCPADNAIDQQLRSLYLNSLLQKAILYAPWVVVILVSALLVVAAVVIVVALFRF